ncbi:type I-E CRISPR-associated protein Cse2/CasB [Kitasatospora sp. NPDC056138]|uniref:type I-E CRISPR-associated protein Cse2/CasB n=1 Tax=Kitasatospora sp. NPDC056138 TaxID=3345724 RepID=UPI0035E05A28
MTTTTPRAPARVNRYDTYLAVVRKACASPAGRAALRDGLPDDFRNPWPMYRHLLRHGTIPCPPDRDSELPFLLVAALYAAHDAPNPSTTVQAVFRPRSSRPWRNLGWSYRAAVRRGTVTAGRAEDDLNSIVQLTLPGLYRALPRVVGQLRSQDVSVEWAVLLKDLTRWQRHRAEVCTGWARAFYDQDPRSGR